MGFALPIRPRGVLLRWVGNVSNLPKNPDLIGSRLSGDVIVRKADRTDTHAALRLVLGSSSELASDEQVVDFLRFAMQRRIDLSDLWVAERNGQFVWAILPVPSPGRTMVLFVPPHVAPTLQDTVAPQLIEQVLAQSAANDVHLAQVLIDSGDVSVIRLFMHSGFERLAELVYMSRDSRRGDAESVQLPPRFGFYTYTPERHATFARTISETYQGSIDCPGLNGRRHIEDILEGHKAVGHFDPKLWFLLHDGMSPCGVALFNPASGSENVELVYLGLVPNARGRGLADLLLRQGLQFIYISGAKTTTLAVDSTNTPALVLYKRHRFKTICSRLALLRDLRKPITERNMGASPTPS